MYSSLKLLDQTGVYNGQEVVQNTQLNSRIKLEKRQTNFGILTDAIVKTKAEIQLALKSDPRIILNEFAVDFDKETSENVLLNQYNDQYADSLTQGYLPGFEPFEPMTFEGFSDWEHQNIFGIYIGGTYKYFEKGRYESTTRCNFFYYPNLEELRVQTYFESMSFYPGNRKQYSVSDKFMSLDEANTQELQDRLFEVKTILNS